MKYYAVTEDPRELYHYGVKGMKWGQHIFGDKPKSPGYRRAAKKLKAISAKAVKRAKQTSAQVAYNHRARQQDKFAKAVQKEQQRSSMIEALSAYDNPAKAKIRGTANPNLAKNRAAIQNEKRRSALIEARAALDQQNSFRKQINRDLKFERSKDKLYDINAKRELKNLRKSVKAEKKLDKYMQQAREGRLHYGKLSEEQIHKVQERLLLENQARQLGGKEKPSWRQQKKEARRAGKLKGITNATSAVMEEVARGAAQFGIQGLHNRMMMKSAAKHEGQYQRAKDKARNKRTAKDIHDEVRDKIRQEVYENEVREGGGMLDRAAVRLGSTSSNAQLLKVQNSVKEQKRLETERKKLQDDIYRKLVLGDKNRAPIADPEERQKLYDQIYGTSKVKNISNASKDKKDSKDKKAVSKQLAELLNNYRPPKGFTGDSVLNDSYSEEDKIKIAKSIERNRKKQAKKQRIALHELGVIRY